MRTAAFVNPLPALLRPSRVDRFRRFFGRASSTCVSMSLASVSLNPALDVHIVPILDDNFSYLIHDKRARTAALVDPAVPQPLLKLAGELDAAVTTSLTTHHHWDHAGGNEELATLVPGVEIIGSAYETAPAVTTRLSTGDVHKVRESSIVVRAMRTPCHTSGHLCFAVAGEGRGAVFTGDTLFVAGCGRFFEGDAADMHASLNDVLAGLDDDTLVFCGHEYTVANLRFAASVEPGNERVSAKLEWAQQRLREGLPTVPSTIGEEKLINPFMRNVVEEVKNAMGLPDGDAVSVMKALREGKNSFRPARV